MPEPIINQVALRSIGPCEGYHGPDHWYITFIPVLGKYTNTYLLMYNRYLYMYYTQRSNPWYTCICAYVTGWFVGVSVCKHSSSTSIWLSAIENPSNQPWLGVTIKNISPHPELRSIQDWLVVSTFNPSEKYEGQFGWLLQMYGRS